MPQGSAKSPQATGELDLSTSLQSDSYLFYEMKFYLLCANLIKEINVTGMQRLDWWEKGLKNILQFRVLFLTVLHRIFTLSISLLTYEHTAEAPTF